MGSSSSLKKLDENNEFFLEAFQNLALKSKGLDLEKSEIQTSKTLKKVNDFTFDED